MKKKHIISICLVIFLMQNILSFKANAQPKNIYVDARSAIAIDSKSKCVLYEKNSDMLIPIASTTKIVTTLVALKYGDLDRKVEISDRAANIHGSQAGYKKDEIVSLRELLYGLMLRSGNDAAIAIAEGMCGSVDEFLKLMNEYAVQIGALNSHFESPHGLDSQNHYSTAYDLAIITAKAKENELFNKIVSVKDVDAKEYGFTKSYHNINKILYQIPNANGVKTGYTGGAGKCLVTSVENGEDDIIVVVLNCSNRWNETKKIYDHVKKNYNFKKVVSKDETIDTIYYGKNKKVNLVCNEDIIIPVGNDETYELKVVKPKIVPSKLVKGSNLGKVCIYKNNNLVVSKPLNNKEEISQGKYKNIKDIIKKIRS